jgi:NAD(P)-dependent dehydrogenase (short-subunit alcohol dehydrogenase family)
MKLAGKVCVVSGGSRGLGRSIADLLAGQGAALAVCARGERELQAAADELRRRYGREVFAAALDVRDETAVAEFARAAERELGAAYALVNNAAVLGPVGGLHEIDLAEWTRALEVNVVGVVNMCAAFAPQMARAGGGAIVNLSGGGIGGPSAPDRITAYTTSKAGVVMLTEALARELLPSAVRVNAIAPGPLATGFLRPVLEAGPWAVSNDLFATATAMGSSATGELEGVDKRLASLLLFLLSDESSWLTGKLVSARWESVEGLRAAKEQIRKTSLFTLRRIDGSLFRESEEDG